MTGTEVGDEESYYEIEVTLDYGTEVDVQLAKDFKVVGSETDTADSDQDEADQGALAGSQDVDAALAICGQQLGIHDIVQVHTGGQFWALQTAEVGLFVPLAAITAAVCFWWLDHRTN